MVLAFHYIKDVSHVQKRKEHHVCLDSRGTALASDLVIRRKKKPEMSFFASCLTFLCLLFSPERTYFQLQQVAPGMEIGQTVYDAH